MATVEKDINEVSDKISKVKRIVKKRVEELEYKEIAETPISDGESWKEKNFMHPDRTVRLGTVLVELEQLNMHFKG